MDHWMVTFVSSLYGLLFFRKKKKSKEKKKIEEALEQEQQLSPDELETRPLKTKAELAFENRKWKKVFIIYTVAAIHKN